MDGSNFIVKDGEFYYYCDDAGKVSQRSAINFGQDFGTAESCCKYIQVSEEGETIKSFCVQSGMVYAITSDSKLV